MNVDVNPATGIAHMVTQPPEIASVGVIGAGQMGNGIAHVCALAGLPVTIVDIKQDALAKAMTLMARNMDRQVNRSIISGDQRDDALARIQTSTDYSAFADVDLPLGHGQVMLRPVIEGRLLQAAMGLLVVAAEERAAAGEDLAVLSRRIADYADYRDRLEADAEEFRELFNTILINVTGFFRDPDAWQVLQEEIVPQLVASVPDDEQIRVWSAGCASGEEAYTAAIVLLEVLGEEAFRRRVKIYATDVDEEALSEARAAVYPAKALAELPPALVEKYFVENGRGLAFRPDLRRSVIFGRNELLQDAPISRIDLLLCRNVLMYFTVDAQTRILSQLNFALRDRGYLMLGKSEMLVRHADYFAPVDLRWRVFQSPSKTCSQPGAFARLRPSTARMAPPRRCRASSTWSSWT